MRLSSLFFLIALSSVALGQQPHGEDAACRQLLLQEAKATSISETKPAIKTHAEPLKVFVYAPGQDELRSDFTGWLAEWNKSDGGKHGQLEVTADASQADIILARFVSALNLKLGESKEAISIDYDRATNAVTHGTVARAKASTPLSYYANVYCYVVEKDEGRLNILWHGTDAVKIYHDVKARGGNYKNLKGTKDSGSAGDRLRNKFFEMIKASSRT